MANISSLHSDSYLENNSNLLFINSNIDDYQTLIPGVDNAEIIFLDSTRDGIEQITETLTNYDTVTSIEILSHGQEGSLQLGSVTLNQSNLERYASELTSWSQSITVNGDILLYGCNIAAGTTGVDFINQLSQLTDADIAASDDLTGNSQLGGDWDLEVTTGEIEANIAIDANARNAFNSVLATYNGNEYQLTSGAKTWEQAQAEAVSLGGNLVTINNAAEETWLKQTFGETEGLWIGINDRLVEGQFEWASGEALTYTNWAPGEPNNGGGNQDFGWMNYGGSKQWDDHFPTAQLRGIIEISETQQTYTYNDHEYLLTSSAKTWEQAQAEAVSLGGNLVTINNAAEETWLKQTFGETEGLWIGINDRRVEGQFEWASGEALTYTNWAPGEPNNGGGNQDFGWMNYGGSKQWDDHFPTAQLRGIIEIDNNNPPNPNPDPNDNKYRYIRFVANSEVNGNPWTSVAELNVLDANGNNISQANWNLVSVDSEESVVPYYQAIYAFDGNRNTFWHTEFSSPGIANDPAHNHEIMIDLGDYYELSGFSYLPRQDGGANGRVANYQFFAGDDTNTSNWGAVIAKGTFANNATEQTVIFNDDPAPQAGLVGYWQFNEISPNSQVIDSSGNDNNGTNVNINPGNTSYSGPINSAPIFETFNPRSGNFDGINDYVSIDNSPEFDFSNGQFTQSVWIRPTATDNNYHGILGYQNGSGSANRAPSLWSYQQTKIHAGFGDGTNWNNFVTGDVLKLNEWNHVVSSFDGNAYKIHVDGVEVFSTIDFAGRKPINVQDLDIGRVDNYFKGQIDEVRLYNRALDTSEVQGLFTAQPNKAQVGDWSSPIDFPNIPVAAAVLPNGKVVTWSAWDRFTFGGNGPRQSYTSIWDPETGEVGEVLVTNTLHDMFCPGIAMLPDGRLLVNGGGESVTSTSIYDFETGTWSDGPDMNYRRWYNTSLTLGNGDVFTIGGERDNNTGGKINTGVGEIWNEATGWRTLSGTPIAPIANSGDRGTEHPQVFLAPNGKVFAAGPSPTMYWYDINGNGSISEAGIRGDSPYSQVGAAIMYDEGKILTTGGSNLYSGGADVFNAVYAIDINNENAVTVDQQDPMSYQRNYQTGVVLSNGEVLIVGGEKGNRAFNDSQAVYRPELWNPETGEWTLMDNHEIPRTYHSVALLLPDGRVMAGGGGLAGVGNPVNHPDVEIFTPPYLYNEDGTLADRPVIGGGVDSVGYNQSFSISMNTDMPITEFNLVRMSAVTHGVNTDQRFLSVDFTDLGNNNYELNSPDNGNIAPPGQYMLFAMNDQGVPSEAKIIQIS